MIYTVSKKNYLIVITFIFTFFLFGCNKDIAIDNIGPGNNIVIDNTKIDNESGSTTSETKNDIQSKENELYENKKEGFSLKIPTGRKFQENIYGSLVFISSPTKQGDTMKENLSISIDSKSNKNNLEEYYSEQKQGIQDQIKDYKEISKEEYKIAKTDGIKMIYQGILGNNNFQRQQIIFYKNGKFFLITYTATQDTFDEYINQINEIIESLKF